MRPTMLDAVPHAEPLGEQDGQGDWHENAEVRSLCRLMTDEEAQDHRDYDRSVYRMRERSLAALLELYGPRWAWEPSLENRHAA